MSKSTRPKLEDDPAFQERMADALGGAPSTPAQFQPITNGSSEPGGAMGEITTVTPQVSGVSEAKVAPKTIFDENPAQAQHAMRLKQVRRCLHALVSAIASKTDGLAKSLEGITDDKDFVAYCKKQGFEAHKAVSFLTDLNASLDGISA